eukprot:CAMPEP_0115174140 /NCGR_PEP_ID=MMETSP0270-20121206/3685_1 /TAXON_ID=71861 /ORGANISM="Scrippsiella trochoidea, Strain CCMP3099" /LENGTH=75 /DNA_ID=CAMNT_0002586969 /DNA_START=1031 /DNA_END=1254 /DNA_ORIENTATION=-
MPCVMKADHGYNSALLSLAWISECDRAVLNIRIDRTGKTPHGLMTGSGTWLLTTISTTREYEWQHAMRLLQGASP